MSGMSAGWSGKICPRGTMGGRFWTPLPSKPVAVSEDHGGGSGLHGEAGQGARPREQESRKEWSFPHLSPSQSRGRDNLESGVFAIGRWGTQAGLWTSQWFPHLQSGEDGEDSATSQGGCEARVISQALERMLWMRAIAVLLFPVPAPDLLPP